MFVLNVVHVLVNAHLKLYLSKKIHLALLNFAKIAKKKEVNIISITRTQKNQLSKISDVNLKTVEYKDRTIFRERLVTESFLFLLDLLILSVVKLRPEIAEKSINKNRLYTKPAYVEPND